MANLRKGKRFFWPSGRVPYAIRSGDFVGLLIFLVTGLSGVYAPSVAADRSIGVFEAVPHASAEDVALPFRKTEVRLRNGNVVGFVRVEDVEGNALGIGIFEIQRVGNRSVAQLFDLAAIDPVDLFVSLTSRGTKLPSLFGDMVQHEVSMKDQGWALDDLLGGAPPYHSGDEDCVDSWREEFRGPLLSHGDTQADMVKSTGPEVDPWLWDEMLIADRFALKATGFDLRSVAMSVRWCGQGSEADLEPSLHIRFYVRHSAGWEQKVSVASVIVNGEPRALEVGDQVNFSYAPYSVNDAGFDAKLQVDYARYHDLFHVGVTWTPTLGELK